MPSLFPRFAPNTHIYLYASTVHMYCIFPPIHEDWYQRHCQQYFSYVVPVSFILVKETGVPGDNNLLPQVTDKPCIEYISSWAGFELTTLLVICTDCIYIKDKGKLIRFYKDTSELFRHIIIEITVICHLSTYHFDPLLAVFALSILPLPLESFPIRTARPVTHLISV